MAKRSITLLLTLCLLLTLLPFPAQAAEEPRVKVVSYFTDDWTFGEWVEYEFNGTRFRSDKMGAAFNLRAFNLMSSADKRLCVNVCGYRNRQEQFGVDGATEMCNWLDEYLGWKDARKVLQDRIAKREFGPVNSYFANETVSAFDEEFAAQLELHEELPEVQALLALRRQLDATYQTGKNVAATLSDATMDKVNAGVKILGKETVSLITDRVLVPAITPAGMAALGADVAEEVITFVDKATGMTDALYNNIGLGTDNDPTALMNNLNALISENSAAANLLMEESQMLQGDLEEAVMAAEAAIADSDSKTASYTRAAGSTRSNEQPLQWYGARSGNIQKKLDELTADYMKTFEDWQNLLRDELPEVAAKQILSTREGSGDVVLYDVPMNLPIIKWDDYRDAYTTGDTAKLNTYAAWNPVITEHFAAVMNGTDTLDNCFAQWGAQVEAAAEKEQHLRGKLTFLSEQIEYYDSMLTSILSSNMGSALEPYAKAVYDGFTKFFAHQYALIEPQAHGYPIPNLTGKADDDCGYITHFEYAARAANLHFMDEDFNHRSSYAADFEIVKDEIISLYYSAKAGHSYSVEELTQIQLDYLMWGNAFRGGLDGTSVYSCCPKGTVYASEYLTWLCSEQTYYNFIKNSIYTVDYFDQKMTKLYNTYFGSLGGQDGLIWQAAGLSKAPVELLPVGEPAAFLRVGETKQVGVRISPESYQADIRWSADDASIATVQPDGSNAVITAVAAGTTAVTAAIADSDVQVRFTVTVTEQAPNRFDDVPESAYYCDAVNWAVSSNITLGTASDRFSPDKSCTRGQIVTFLWRALGSPEPQTTVSSFTDVKDSTAYYYEAVLWAVENEITKGTSQTRFSPNATVSRAQSVTFQWRAAGSPEPKTAVNGFTDVTDSAYYYKAVLWAVENEITKGTSQTRFSPDAPCTRAQIVTLLYRQLAG